MGHGDMTLLNASGIFFIYPEQHLRHLCHLTGVGTSHTNGAQSPFSGHDQCLHNIDRISTCAQAPGHITFHSQRFYLFAEDVVKSVIVSHAGENGCICG